MTKVAILNLIISSLLLPQAYGDNDLGEYVLTTCPIEVPQELLDSGKMSYGYMSVPELHEDRNGNTIGLAVAVFKCRAESATLEPLVLNTGGPGLSNMDNFIPDLCGDLGDLFLVNRDIVIIELRGLKYSKPNLFTPELDALQLDLVDEDLSLEETTERYLATLKGVYDRFTKQGINLSAYNNLEIANDIVYVMQQLGYDKFSVFGSSFGTLVAQYLLLHHDEHLVSVVMNATVDLNKALYGMHTNSLNALDTLFERCANDEKYAAAFPDLKNRFIALLEKLNAHPETITVKYEVDGKDYEVIFNGNKLSVWLFAEMYWNTQIPLTLHKLLAGDYSDIQARPGMIFPINEFSNGLSLSIFLSELPELKKEHLPIDGEYANFVKGCGTMIFSPLFLSRAQEVWPVRKVSSAQKTLTTDVPILMLSGEMDHVCPPSYATELSEELKNAHLFVFPGVAHSPVDVGPCGILMTKEFFDDPSKAPDSACMSVFKSEFVLPE